MAVVMMMIFDMSEEAYIVYMIARYHPMRRLMVTWRCKKIALNMHRKKSVYKHAAAAAAEDVDRQNLNSSKALLLISYFINKFVCI